MTPRPEYTPDAESLERILKRLRAPGGCPWDREQTRETLSRSLAEEAAEVLDAIDRGNAPDICDELGDLLMNVIFQAVVAEERGEFTFQDVCGGIIDKMIRRHAHIFGDAKAETAGDVAQLWEKIKAGERKDKPAPQSILDKVPPYLSALNRAEKLQKKVSKVGFDWDDQAQILAKIEEELEELKEAFASGDAAAIDDEFGDLLFAASNLARFRNEKTSEELLRQSNRKFETRFRYIERELAGAGIPLEEAGIDRMEALWQAAKQAEKEAAGGEKEDA